MPMIFINCTLLISYTVADDGICSSGASAATGGCIAYEHANFDGMRQDLRSNRIKTYVGDKMNDEIS